MGGVSAVVTAISLLIGTTLSIPYGYEQHHRQTKHQDNGQDLVYVMPPLQPPQPYVLPYTPWIPYDQRDNKEERLIYANPMFQEQIAKQNPFLNLGPYSNHQPYGNGMLEELMRLQNEYFGQTAAGYIPYDQQYSPRMQGPTGHSNGIVYEEYINTGSRRTPRGHHHYHHHSQQQEENIFGKQYVNSQFEKHKPSNYEQRGQYIQTPDSEYRQQQQQQSDIQEFEQQNSYGQRQSEQFNEKSQDFGQQQSDLTIGEESSVSSPESGNLMVQSQLQIEANSGQQYQSGDQQETGEFPDGTQEQQTNAFQEQSDLEFVSNKPQTSGRLIEPSEQETEDFGQQFQTQYQFQLQDKHHTDKLTEDLHQQQTEEHDQQEQSDLELGSNKPSTNDKLQEQQKQELEHLGQQDVAGSRDERQTGQHKFLGTPDLHTEDFSQQFPSQNGFKREYHQQTQDILGQQIDSAGHQQQEYWDLEFSSNKPQQYDKLTDTPGQETDDLGQQYQSQDQLGQKTEDIEQQSDLTFGSSKPSEPEKLADQIQQENEDFGQQYQGQEQQTDLELGSSKPKPLADQSEQQSEGFGQQAGLDSDQSEQQSEDFGQQYQGQEEQSDLELGSTKPKPGKLVDQSEQQNEDFGQQYQGQEQQSDLGLGSIKPKPGKLVEQQSEAFGQGQDTEEYGQQHQQSDFELGASKPQKPGKLVDQSQQQNEDFVQQSDLEFGSSNPRPGELIDQTEQQNEDFGQQYQGQEQQSDLGLGSTKPKPGKLVEQQSGDFGQGQNTEEYGQQHQQSDFEFGSYKPKPGNLYDQSEQQSEVLGQQYQGQETEGFGQQQQQQPELEFGFSKPSEQGKLFDQSNQQNKDSGQQSDTEFGSNRPQPGKADQSEQQSEGFGQQYQGQETENFGQQQVGKDSNTEQQQSQDILGQQQQQPQNEFGQQSQDIFDQEQSQDMSGQQQSGDVFSQQNQDKISVNQETNVPSLNNYNKAIDMMHELETLVTQGMEKEGENKQAETIQQSVGNENKPNENEEIVEAFGFVPDENPHQQQIDVEFPHGNKGKSILPVVEPEPEVTEAPSFWGKMKSNIQNKVSNAYSTVRDKAKELAKKVKEHISSAEE